MCLFSSEEDNGADEAGEVRGGLDAGDLRQQDDLLLLRSRQSFAGKQDGAKAANARHARHAEQQNLDGVGAHSGLARFALLPDQKMTTKTKVI